MGGDDPVDIVPSPALSVSAVPGEGPVAGSTENRCW